MSTGLLVILTIVAIIVLFFIMSYNTLVRKGNEVDNAFGGVDVQLKKRYDLIPNLVSVVGQYVAHEKELLVQITQIRAKASDGNLSPDEKVDLDNQISSGIGKILLTVENYPELKASESFLHLQRSLNEVELQISAARRAYNAVITDYNNAIQMFPGFIMAAIMGLKQKSVFAISENERQNVDVKSLF